LSFHQLAVVLTLVQTKQIRINIHKRNNTKTQHKQYKTQHKQYKNKTQTIQKHNTNNTSTHITKTPTQLSKHNTHTHTHTHTNIYITKQVKTTTVQDTHEMKWSQYNQLPSA
jgi:hypothetical protein